MQDVPHASGDRQTGSPAAPGERILFVTGRLAAASLERVLASLAQRSGFTYEIRVLGISVAALMHADWVARKLTDVEPGQRVILPGLCRGNLETLNDRFQAHFELGPKDLFDLPEYFTGETRSSVDLTAYNIEILAEINHAPRLSPEQLVAVARGLVQDGADVIDLGGIPGESWRGAGDAVRRLRSEGFRVSIDSFEQDEVQAAVAAGAELVLSCNHGNVQWLSELDVEVVAIPDEPQDLDSLARLVEKLEHRDVRYRLDPILEPIGFGFAASLQRYATVRARFPDAAMMMGIGNLTELTEVDSAGVNMLLIALCEELGIHSVLTTQVINWCRSSVAEIDAARRLVRHSLQRHVLPKHLDSRLVMLRDPRVHELGDEELARLAGQLTDPNFRIFAERDEVYIMNRDGLWHDSDPFALFDQFSEATGPLSASHAFYLGYEISKAVTALTLGKQYRQDQALTWGMLTRPERSAEFNHRIQRERDS